MDIVKGKQHFRVLLKSNLSREDMFIYTMKRSVALVKTLEKNSVLSKIKFPSDILVNEKRIFVILIES